jgi:endonuclease/exonuclease/phosphatase family metal-dependent hydrolase
VTLSGVLTARGLVVGTHNLMNGLRLRRLLRHYRVLRDAVGLDVLCVQENRCSRRVGHGFEIARALGARYAHLADRRDPDVGIIYDRERFRCREHVSFPLPQVPRLSWLERCYSGRHPRVHLAQVAVLEDGAGLPLTVANFHLSTAGGTRHRCIQMEAVVKRIRAMAVPERTIACGDTNAFHWSQRAQPRVLDNVLAPLAAIGARPICDARPTHHFARQHEPKLTHRAVVMLGKLGIDLPQRYDVVCSNLPGTRGGKASTPDSDHDLVWAALLAQPALTAAAPAKQLIAASRQGREREIDHQLVG